MAQKLELAQVIKALRNELATAKQAGIGETIRFNVNSVDIEFETAVEVEGSLEAGGKIKFWVLDIDAKASGTYTNATTHKIKLSLAVLDEENPDPVTGEAGNLNVGGDSQHPPMNGAKKGNDSLGGDS